MARKGIGPMLGAAIPALISGLLKKKDRDAATPKGAGALRDIGVTAMGASGASMALIDCATYGLSDAHCSLVHGLALVLGFVFYLIGVGQKSKENER